MKGPQSLFPAKPDALLPRMPGIDIPVLGADSEGQERTDESLHHKMNSQPLSPNDPEKGTFDSLLKVIEDPD